ncbi:uncharacterized protein LOC113238100 [Hyposmocoma kahamanoa]|uniref:uncharacterized protein LOC113238100 n=1 Tax=Hyposmocoma kahamanoa TaxID=1477025 RepID=UPI000E6D9226|nr:uncharacterized protein LOC113238100 [Hyposmocoma kahamanoa]
MFRCTRCSEDTRDAIQCSNCKNHYDYPCSGLTEAGYRKLGASRQATWKCHNCKCSASSAAKQDIGSPKPLSLEDLMIEITNVKLTLAPLMEVMADIKSIKTDINNLRSNVDQFTSKLNSLDERLKTVEKGQNEVCQLKAQISKLEEDLNSNNQWMRRNNVEIKGVPLKDRENLFDIVSKIGAKIHQPISKHDINFIARIPSRENRVKPIVVSFLNRYLKEDFVAGARSLKSLCPADINLEGTNRIYINDHLTIQNKALLTKAKQLAKENEFEFVWVKNSKIFTRRDSQSKVIAIKNERDLQKIQ